MEWAKRIGIILMAEVMGRDGRYANVIEGVNCVDLQFQLL